MKDELYFLEIADLEGRKMELCYFIFEQNGSFSLGIRLKTSEIIEEKIIEDVTTVKERAEEIAKVLYKGSVTPTTLYDIIYDLL